MSTVITYTDQLGNPISEDLLSSVEEYFQTVNDDNQKKTNCFRGGKLVAITYNIFSVDEIPTLLTDQLKIFFVIETQIGRYNTEERLHYENGKLTRHSRYIWDDDENMICEMEYDVISEKVLWIEKIYQKDERYYIFSYDKNGGLISVWMMNEEHQADMLYPIDFERKPALRSFWEGLDYYRHAEPLIPVT